MQAAVDNFGRLDGVTCCAGIMVQKFLWEMEERDWDDVIAVHLKGHFSCAQAAARIMMPQGSGRLVFISSGALAGIASQPSYSTAKAGILGFTWSCSSALFPYGITTNCVVPSAATRMSDKTFSDYVPLSDAVGETVRSERAGGSYRDPVNIAPVVGYLLSDAAADVNGQVFRAIGYQIDRMGALTYDRTMTNQTTWEIDELIDRVPKELGPDLKREPLPWPPPGR
jgi:NAD(P)-dependent dehydrogenase (short-subunit alcohol dehydrogenase family)